MENINVIEAVCVEKHKKVESDAEKLEKRVSQHGEELDSVSKILAAQTVILEGLAEVVKELQAKPGRRWEAVISQIITILVAAAFGGAVGKLF